MRTTNLNELMVRVLVSGLDDWVPLATIAAMVRQRGKLSDDKVKAEVQSIVREIISRQLATFGAVTRNGFIPFEGSLDAILEVIARESDVNWEFSGWLNNTEQGDRIAEAMVKKSPK